jgi:SAM-dependent methyltransferase
MRTCRLCGGEFFADALLQYANMPKAAQNLPDAAALASEKGADLEVCQCARCGLVQLSNEPVPYFREVIRAAAVSDVIADAKRKQLGEFIQKFSLRGKKVLEIGCGRGEFLSLLPPDVHAFGLEYSESAVAECVKHGLNVSRGYPAGGAGGLPNAPFDAFLLLMFLEHMPEPNVALKTIYASLSDGAVGLVEVPNFDLVLRNKLFSEFIGDHLLYFTRATLQTTLQTNGFDLVECGELRDAYVISAIVKKRSRLDLAHFRQYQAAIKAELAAFLNRFPEKRVAIWGAGHQALALIALTGIAGRIRYVVDSAPFKQGRFTPATHLPIMPPDALAADPVDAVIVIAGSYSDEVAGIIRQRFARELSVAILRDFGLQPV